MWSVSLHKLAVKDLEALDVEPRRRILKAIQKKLATSPRDYGAPMRDKLFGYWKLRVDNYRVIYRMKDNILQVLVVQIGIRRDSEVYESLLKRLDTL